MKIERRYTSGATAKTRVSSSRSNSNDSPIIRGHAAVFYDGTPETEYEYGDIRERIMPTAFDRALKEKDDARALFNHNPDNLLGRVSVGTLALSVDHRGLAFAIRPDPDLEVTKSVLSWLKRGEIRGCSFAFSIRKNGEEWTYKDGRHIREITSVELYDVGPVTYPAYPTTDAHAGRTTGIPKLGAAWDDDPGCAYTTNDGEAIVMPVSWQCKSNSGRSLAARRRQLRQRRAELDLPRRTTLAERRAKLDEYLLPEVIGYAALWGSKFAWRDDRRGWFSRGSFTKALLHAATAGYRTRVLVGHEGPSIATAQLWEDEIGLRFKFRPHSTDAGRAALAKIDRGRLSGVSPRIIYHPERQWFIGEGREADWFIHDVSEVPEISLTSRPVQLGTCVAVRRTPKQLRRRLEEREREIAQQRRELVGAA